MKVLYLLLSILILIPQVLKSQDSICGMPPPSKEELNHQLLLSKDLGPISAMSSQSNITVNVVFHIRNNLISFEKTTEMMNILNSSFAAHNISFNRLCVNFNPTSAAERLPYAINIFVEDLSGSGIAGYAGGYGSNYLVISYGRVTTSTLPHEMGHCLYLFHTHNEVGCPELVNGSNCNECGDYVCDTPADPKLYTNRYWVDSQNNCTYTGTFTDANGSPYNPDTRNFMSYSPASCRNRFTQGQGQRMYNALLSLPVLIPATKPPEIQGPNVVCSNSPFSFKVLPNSTITWSSSNPNGLSIDPDTGEATRLNNFLGIVTITVTINGVCGTTNQLTKKVGVGNYLPLGISSYNSNCSGGTFNILNTSLSAACTANSPIYFQYRISDPNYSNFVFTPVSVPSGATWSSGGGNLYVTVYSPPSQGSRSATIALSAAGPCGPYSINFTSTAVNYYSGGYYYSYFPNPASQTLSIEQTFNIEENIEVGTFQKVGTSETHYFRLYDFNSYKVVLEGSLLGKTDVDISKLTKGRYVLKIQINKDKEETHHVIIN